MLPSPLAQLHIALAQGEDSEGWDVSHFRGRAEEPIIFFFFWTLGPSCRQERASPVWLPKFPAVSWKSKPQFSYNKMLLLCMILTQLAALEAGFLSSPASTTDTRHHAVCSSASTGPLLSDADRHLGCTLKKGGSYCSDAVSSLSGTLSF